MSLNDIYNSYMAKNILNKYRQRRGYKKATDYIKVVEKKEDNIAVLEVLQKMNDKNEPLEIDFIFNELDQLGYGNLKIKH